MNNNFHPGKLTSALILASGLSERMRQPKALLRWDSSRTFIGKIIAEYLDAGCGKIICTVNHMIYQECQSLHVAHSVRFILNEHPEWGRLYSVKLGLKEVGDSAFCFIQNVDNPHITSCTIRKILENADPVLWCSPGFRGQGGHPVLLPAIIIDHIMAERNTENTLKEVLDAFPKKVVEMADDSVLRNINTPEDYQALLKWIR